MATTDVVPPGSRRATGQQAHRQRHEHSGRDGERLGLAEFQYRAAAQHFPDGRAGFGQEPVPLEYRGLPTWYTIRANKDGYIGRKKEIDFLVAMNPETAQEDVMSLAPGASVLYDEPLALNKLRNDLIFYSVPYDKLVAPVCPEAKLRKLVKNMVYVGVVAQLLEIDMGEVEKAIRKQFAKKAKAANLNLAAAQAGFDYAKANLQEARRLLH